LRYEHTSVHGSVTGKSCFLRIYAAPCQERHEIRSQVCMIRACSVQHSYPRSFPFSQLVPCRDLSFIFPGHTRPTLRDINLTIEAGESVAIVGLNGGGKSTLLAVLARLVDFSSGSYHVNGVDTRRINAMELHARTSAIFQSFCKFDQTSVRENTGVGAVTSLSSPPSSPEFGPSAEDRIWQALESAGAKKFVEDFPDSLETLLEVDGLGRTKHFHHLQHYNHPPPPYAAASSLQLQGLHSVYGTPDTLSADGDVSDARLSGGQVRLNPIQSVRVAPDLIYTIFILVATNCYRSSSHEERDI